MGAGDVGRVAARWAVGLQGAGGAAARGGAGVVGWTAGMERVCGVSGTRARVHGCLGGQERGLESGKGLVTRGAPLLVTEASACGFAW